MPKHLNTDLRVKKTGIPNKIFNILLKLGWPKFEKLYGDFDVLWMPDLRPFAINAKTKLAVTVHDLSPVIHPELYSTRRRIWHAFLNYEKSFRRADLLLAVSDYTKFDLIKFFGIAPEKIKVVYPGINHKLFNAELDERLKHKVRQKYGLPENFILSISTIEPRKNLLGLIEAFEKISDQDSTLVLAGRLGWVYQEILEKIRNSPKKDKIKLLGYVDEADKPYLIGQSSILCYPSFYEGFGFQPLEAMACGVPVITSARTSMPEVCRDAALLVEPYHLEELTYAIDSLLSDQTLRQRLIQKGLAHSRQFSWEESAKKIEQELTAQA